MADCAELRAHISPCKCKENHVAEPRKRYCNQHYFTRKDVDYTHDFMAGELVICPETSDERGRNYGENKIVRRGCEIFDFGLNNPADKKINA